MLASRKARTAEARRPPSDIVCNDLNLRGKVRRMSATFRKGAVGALMDEYERAARELKALVESIPDDVYTKILDARTRDEDCRSVQSILSHVVSSAYSYADYLRGCFQIPSTRPVKRTLSRSEALEGIDAVLKYTEQTLDGRWEMPEKDMMNTVMRTTWDVVYDMEQLLEHAIVHMLRHRRQIRRLLS